MCFCLQPDPGDKACEPVDAHEPEAGVDAAAAVQRGEAGAGGVVVPQTAPPAPCGLAPHLHRRAPRPGHQRGPAPDPQGEALHTQITKYALFKLRQILSVLSCPGQKNR